MTIAKYCAQPITDPQQQKQTQLIATTQEQSQQRATIPGTAQFVANASAIHNNGKGSISIPRNSILPVFIFYYV